MAQCSMPEPGAGDAATSPRGAERPVEIHRLIDDHHQAVFRYALRLAGSAADAEDLTQQTFLIAQQKLHQVRDPERVDRWLLAVLRSCHLKQCRKRIPVTATTLDISVETIAQQTPQLDRLERQEIQAAVHELSEDFRLVLLMFYFEDYSYKDIAAQLDIPIGTVMSRLARAKAHLRAKLSGDEPRRERPAPGGARKEVLVPPVTVAHAKAKFRPPPQPPAQ